MTQIPGIVEFLRKLLEGAGVDYAKEILIQEEISHALWGELATYTSVVNALKALKDEGYTKEQVDKALEDLGMALIQANQALEGRSEVRHLSEVIPQVLQRAVKTVFKEEIAEEARTALRKARLTFLKSVLKRNIKWDISDLLRKKVK